MNQNDPSHLYKVVLVGDAAVGKTHLVNRFIKDEEPQSTIPTIGVEFATKTVPLKDGGQIKAQIWDTAGQEKYRSITSAHYRNAVGGILVFDITKEKSFHNIGKWLEELKTHSSEDIILILVGNKLDLVQENPQMRKISYEQAEQFAKENNMLYEESSAYSYQQTSSAFEKLIEEIYEYKMRQFNSTTMTNQTDFNYSNFNSKNQSYIQEQLIINSSSHQKKYQNGKQQSSFNQSNQKFTNNPHLKLDQKPKQQKNQAEQCC
ncbi:P-loop containing nucleoside triphosphate hydrolase [Pseudocohnilembus persalinus]|uniref:p-loop containing nucleoside triphosphate hydrolase n=1 Tax=Pseudocohnilembus persalinus TaxID=266149 RepID=A0A0V0QMJ6_PSEPJ|nr:P-loop containing nucleoside triphosphate hydrolase [Pseudocohnilembus persalinus]|eukprot:KRX03367.1 P-loop containing nucleoside triphosphate hydrolase [Pseudocohnilembus persalinus]